MGGRRHKGIPRTGRFTTLFGSIYLEEARSNGHIQTNEANENETASNGQDALLSFCPCPRNNLHTLRIHAKGKCLECELEK